MTEDHLRKQQAVADPRQKSHLRKSLIKSCATAVQTSPGDSLGASGVCNADLPNTSAYARFLYVVRYFTANGFYVLIDNHLSFDNTAVSNAAQWLIWYKQLMTDIVQLPSTRNRVMVDIMNEPDVLGLRCVPDFTFHFHVLKEQSPFYLMCAWWTL